MLRYSDAMFSTSRRWRTRRRSMAPPFDSAERQSTSLPSATEAAISASARSSALNVHLLCQSYKSPGDRHSCGIRARLSVRRGDLLIALLHLDARDDHFPFFRFQALHGRLVAPERLRSDCFLERRCRRIRKSIVFLDAGRCRIAAQTSYLVAYSVDEGLSKVGLQRSLVTRLEQIDSPEGLQQRFLHDILRVAEVTGPAREPTASPAAQRRKMSTEEVVQSLGVSRTRTSEEICRSRERTGRDRGRLIHRKRHRVSPRTPIINPTLCYSASSLECNVAGAWSERTAHNRNSAGGETRAK